MLDLPTGKDTIIYHCKPHVKLKRIVLFIVGKLSYIYIYFTFFFTFDDDGQNHHRSELEQKLSTSRLLVEIQKYSLQNFTK